MAGSCYNGWSSNCVEMVSKEVDCKKGGNIVRIYLQGKELGSVYQQGSTND